MVLKEDDKPAAASPPVRSSGDRQADKKRELALHTLSALAELGFAQINLRDVAARSGKSLGAFHYYFEDKTALLIYCVRLYKEDFVQQLEQMIDAADSLADLRDRFPLALSHAVEADGHTHRLWYDVRAQALFDPAFRPVVAEIEARLIGVLERFLGRAKSLGAVDAPADALGLYLTLDGWFRYYLQQHIAGDAGATTALRQRLSEIMPLQVEG